MHQYVAAAHNAPTAALTDRRTCLNCPPHDLCLLYAAAAAVVLQLLRPGFAPEGMLVELQTTCTIAEARASIIGQLQQQLPNEPQAVVLLWRDDRWAYDDHTHRQTSVTAAADEDAVDARTIDHEHPSYQDKTLLVCWLPKVGSEGTGCTHTPLHHCRM
jgi:hypothetical protein